MTISTKIILSSTILCISIIVSGLIVNARYLQDETAYYQSALVYCMENDCTEIVEDDTAEVDAELSDEDAVDADEEVNEGEE